MDNKYIIRNRPCYESEGVFYNCVNKRIEGDCQDCTDCVMKQIVDLCKRTCRIRCTNDCLGTKKHCVYGQILKLLDIHEVE